MYVSKRVSALSLFTRSWQVIAWIAVVVLATTVVHIELDGRHRYRDLEIGVEQKELPSPVEAVGSYLM